MITDVSKLSGVVSEPIRFINDAEEKEKAAKVLSDLEKALSEEGAPQAVSAPQLGENYRAFGIRFDDQTKLFLNPIVKKKSNYALRLETCASMPGKEILIARPEEVSVVYYTKDFAYEDNKLLGQAARLFDQMYQFLDGLTPEDTGLVSDIEENGSFSDLKDDEMEAAAKIYKQYIDAKAQAAKKGLEGADEETKKKYRELSFMESVVNGNAAIVAGDKTNSKAYRKAQASAAMSLSVGKNLQKQANRQQLSNFLKRHKGKSHRRK